MLAADPKEIERWPVKRRCIEVLSRLLLTPRTGEQNRASDEDTSCAALLNESDLPVLLDLAQKHHVVVRALGPFLDEMLAAGDYAWAEWALSAIGAERARIRRALEMLGSVVYALQETGCSVVVIKSLDHWPDLGNDLDLYTRADPEDVAGIMTGRLGARRAPRSWGDRMASKWGFFVPGVPEMVEVHFSRLGQVGEHTNLGPVLDERASFILCGGHNFLVPCSEDRIILSTLQRMYRHFYFRLCDVVDTAELIQAKPIDYERLRRTSEAAGIWTGVASLLMIVAGYAEKYRGEPIEVPDSVADAAHFYAEQLSMRGDFLRVPLLSVATYLYPEELMALAQHGSVFPIMRLAVLPWLATAALLKQRLVGSDSGIW